MNICSFCLCLFSQSSPVFPTSVVFCSKSAHFMVFPHIYQFLPDKFMLRRPLGKQFNLWLQWAIADSAVFGSKCNDIWPLVVRLKMFRMDFTNVFSLTVSQDSVAFHAHKLCKRVVLIENVGLNWKWVPNHVLLRALYNLGQLWWTHLRGLNPLVTMKT